MDYEAAAARSRDGSVDHRARRGEPGLTCRYNEGSHQRQSPPAQLSERVEESRSVRQIHNRILTNVNHRVRRGEPGLTGRYNEGSHQRQTPPAQIKREWKIAVQ